MFTNCQRSSLEAKKAVFFLLVIGILLSLVALGFAVMLHGRTGRKTLAFSRISLWDPANNKSLIVTQAASSKRYAWRCLGLEKGRLNNATAIHGAYQDWCLPLERIF